MSVSYPPFGNVERIERALAAEPFEVTVNDDGIVHSPWGNFVVVKVERRSSAAGEPEVVVRMVRAHLTQHLAG